MKVHGNINVLFTGCVSALVNGVGAVVCVPVLSAIYLGHSAPAHSSTESVMALAVVAPVVWAGVGFVFGGLMATIHNLFVDAFLVPQEQHVKEAAMSYAAGKQAA